MTHKFGAARLRSLAAATGTIALMGCGSGETATEQATPAASKAESAAIPDQLVGIWTRNIAGRTSKCSSPESCR
jgi:hypothetical protein